MKRPIGITLLALFHFLGAAVYALLGVAFLTGGTAIREIAGVYGRYGEMIEGLGEKLGVACLVVAAITLAIGIGLWAQKNWARIILVVLTVFSLAVSAIWMVILLVQSRTAEFFLQTLVTTLHLPILWYLVQPRVKQAFGSQPAQPGVAAAPHPETK